jgi:hypothetical protein
VRVYFTRDSVAAGDDADGPHAREIEVPEPVTVADLVHRVWRAADLPRITGGEATWCIASGVPLAVVAQQWASPRLVRHPRLEDLDRDGPTVRLHISYLVQMDPELVYEVLRRLQLRA